MDDRYTVPALQRGLQLLGLFSREHKELSGAEIAKALELPRASVFRMLQTLEQSGFIERSSDIPSYRLGVAVLRLGFEYIASMELAERGAPVLNDLRNATTYSSHLVIRDGRDVVVIAKAVGFGQIYNSIQVGARLPVYATALGRVLLGGATPAIIDKLYSGVNLKAYSTTTPTSIKALRDSVEQIASQGYCVSQGGFETGISSIVAPIFDRRNELCAAISIAVPKQTIASTELKILIAHVQSAASQLTERMGGSISSQAPSPALA